MSFDEIDDNILIKNDNILNDNSYQKQLIGLIAIIIIRKLIE